MSAVHLTKTRQAGFTLVELMVALMAGLIVALGVLLLSREATNTFHEEARTSAAEATLRTAMDRLRGDLQRAGYMSTGNIWADPNIAVPPGGNIQSAVVYPNLSAVTGITQLASIYVQQGGSNTRNGLAQSALQSPAISPDLIQIAGNMTTSDAFDVLMVTPSGGASNGCLTIKLVPNSPAMYRIFGALPTASQSQEFANLFVPSPGGSAQFIVRLVDDVGCSQFLATCGTSPAGVDSTGTPFVSVDSKDTPVVTANETGSHCGISSFGTARSWLNPVQVVQWELTTAAGSPADPEPNAAISAFSEATGDAGSSDGPKYDLMRTYYDITGAAIADTSEVVAEFGVDLSFALSVDTGASALTPSLTTYAFDDPTGYGTWTKRPTSSAPQALVGPQRIRSVRVRMATRTSQADRTVDITPTAIGTQAFMYRYCVLASCSSATSGSYPWARVRTMTSEIALTNQARIFY